MEIKEIDAGYQNLNLEVTRFIFGKHIQLDKTKLNLPLPEKSINLFGEIGFADIVIATHKSPNKHGKNIDNISNSKIDKVFTVGIMELTQKYENKKILKKILDFFIQKANSYNLKTIIIYTNKSHFLINNLSKNGYTFFGNTEYAIKTF
jgi:hypothetical protein